MTPIMTIIVLNTSEAECIASEIIAPDCATIPAASFTTESNIFTTMLTLETLKAISSTLSYFIIVIVKQLLVNIGVNIFKSVKYNDHLAVVFNDKILDSLQRNIGCKFIGKVKLAG